MPNHLRGSRDSTYTPPRHGKSGYVRLHVDVAPDVKDRLIVIAEKDDVPFAVVVRDALDFYLDAVASCPS